ncbi:GNAT family N-acetyltransferase [Nordella sp. HKS 07]|uniref:GNAT family N-acetyltransferase n=1 Tax=Nordella sp. HKS 07 TaxID=2712222 RepID=UPI0013E10B34|nr:N-acetyltransferase [Nordella sp. HKS 07]QIG50348.1 GNAT family N-acetyltransferase [Nordella sp. HKS 07]
MTLMIRPMRAEDAPGVVAMVHGLARDTAPDVTPKLTAESLVDNDDLIQVTVAEDASGILGACLTLLTFSTWRGLKGLYVVDLFIDGKARNRGIGLKLLREAARRGRARGARFIKLEVLTTNDGAARFYERLGFARHDEDRLFVLEDEQVTAFLEERE